MLNVLILCTITDSFSVNNISLKVSLILKMSAYLKIRQVWIDSTGKDQTSIKFIERTNYFTFNLANKETAWARPSSNKRRKSPTTPIQSLLSHLRPTITLDAWKRMPLEKRKWTKLSKRKLQPAKNTKPTTYPQSTNLIRTIPSLPRTIHTKIQEWLHQLVLTTYPTHSQVYSTNQPTSP